MRSTILASSGGAGGAFVAPSIDREKEQEQKAAADAHAAAARTAELRLAGQLAAAPGPSADPTAKAAAAAKAHAAAAKKGRLSASTNPKGERLDIKEKKKQQRMRGQDAHNGVWKSEQEMQLRCTFD